MHRFCSEMQYCFIDIGIADASEQDTVNTEALNAQRRAKREMEKLMEEKGLKKAQLKLVYAIYCYQMFNSDACVKGDPKLVTKAMRELPSDAARYRFLRNNIEARVIGFGGEFERFRITWSHQGKKRSVKELSDHLRKIIREEKKMDIPDKPPASLPERRALPILGDRLTAKVMDIDAKYFHKESRFREDAEKLRKERESRGEGSMYSQLQPWMRPSLESLVDKRIDVLSTFFVKVGGVDEPQLRWCQGRVESVVQNVKQPFVVVEWDGMPDVKGWERKSTAKQRLLPSLWNKDKEGSWRMDVRLEECEPYDTSDYGTDSSDNEISSEDDNESENELSDGEISDIDDEYSTCSDE